MTTVEKTGQNGVDDEGDGFMNVTAAYESLYKQFNPGRRAADRRRALPVFARWRPTRSRSR